MVLPFKITYSLQPSCAIYCFLSSPPRWITYLFHFSLLLVEINGKTIKWKLNIYNYLSLLWRIITPRAHWKISATRAIFLHLPMFIYFPSLLKRIVFRCKFFGCHQRLPLSNMRVVVWLKKKKIAQKCLHKL